MSAGIAFSMAASHCGSQVLVPSSAFLSAMGVGGVGLVGAVATAGAGGVVLLLLQPARPRAKLMQRIAGELRVICVLPVLYQVAGANTKTPKRADAAHLAAQRIADVHG